MARKKSKDWTDEHKRLWKELVPVTGQADTVQGELIRCIGRLTDEAYRNGNVNWGKGHELMTRFVANTLDDGDVFTPKERAKIRRSVKQLQDFEHPDTSGHGGPHYYLAEQSVKWCLAHPELIRHKKNSMLKI